MWQGVPVLTFNGDRWAGRTSRSLLLAAGLPEWVATNEREYVDRAVALAQQESTPGMLARMRDGMRARLRESAACDTTTCAARWRRSIWVIGRRCLTLVRTFLAQPPHDH